MALKKDKQKVLGEFFDDERIKTFLYHEANNNPYIDYQLLEKAYRGMIAENFSSFIGFFKEAGHDINTKNEQGRTFLTTVRDHKQAEEYIQTLVNAGAE